MQQQQTKNLEIPVFQPSQELLLTGFKSDTVSKKKKKDHEWNEQWLED